MRTSSSDSDKLWIVYRVKRTKSPRTPSWMRGDLDAFNLIVHAPTGYPERILSRARAAFVKPILERKGWSILEWASESKVDYHTASDYLKGKTKPYPSTRKKLADALGVPVRDLPK